MYFTHAANNIMPTHYFFKVQAGWGKQFAMPIFRDLAGKSTDMRT